MPSHSDLSPGIESVLFFQEYFSRKYRHFYQTVLPPLLLRSAGLQEPRCRCGAATPACRWEDASEPTERRRPAPHRTAPHWKKESSCCGCTGPSIFTHLPSSLTLAAPWADVHHAAGQSANGPGSSGSSGSSTHDCSALPPNSCFLLRLKRHSGLQTLKHADLKKGEVELEDTSTISHCSGNIQWAVIPGASESRQLTQMNKDQRIFMFIGEFMLIY